MTHWFTLEDKPETWAYPFRSAPWIVSALEAAGFIVQPSHLSRQKTGEQWRTWRVEDRSSLSGADQGLAHNSQVLIEALQTDKAAEMPELWPVLAAFLGARNLDVLEHWLKRGGAKPCQLKVSPLPGCPLTLISFGESEYDLGANCGVALYEVQVSNSFLAAVLITCGFVLQRVTAGGVPLIGGIITHSDAPACNGTEGRPAALESVLCPGLTIPLAVEAAAAVVQNFRSENANSHSALSTLHSALSSPLSTLHSALSSPLPVAHLFHWVVAGARFRVDLRATEAELDDEKSESRTHFFETESTEPAKRTRAALVNWDEFNANEDYIAGHLAP